MPPVRLRREIVLKHDAVLLRSIAHRPRRLERNFVEPHRRRRNQMRFRVFALDGHAQILHSKGWAGRQFRDERIERLISDVGDAIAHQNVQAWGIRLHGENFHFALVEPVSAPKRLDAAAESCREKQQDDEPGGKSASALQNLVIVPGRDVSVKN